MGVTQLDLCPGGGGMYSKSLPGMLASEVASLVSELVCEPTEPRKRRRRGDPKRENVNDDE